MLKENVCSFGKNLILTFFLTIMINSNVASQESPVVIPPSPEAQEFMKYGEYPVDYSTGLPTIEIPLYTVKTNQLELPIYLSYHASGIKPEDIASVVGLGWTLFSGGMVSRSVKGKPDENGLLDYGIKSYQMIYSSPVDANNYVSTDLCNYLYGTSKGDRDSESDSYSYFTNKNISGNFVFDINKKLFKISANNDSIIWNYSNGNWFHIIDEKGIHYYFEQKENLRINSDYTSPFTWYLTKMISPDRNDSICFEYFKNAYLYDKRTESHYAFFGDSPETLLCYPYTDQSGLARRSYSYSSSEHVMISKITFKNGYVDFIYNNNRSDMRAHKLDSVKIFNNIVSTSPICIKKYKFNYGYFGNTSSKYTCRLKLNEVQVYDGVGSFINKYTLGYNTVELPPYINPNYTGTRYYPYDFWGYYNGQSSNEHMLAYLPSQNTPANRTPDAYYAQASILTQVSYPTGGHTNFYYELNRMDDSTHVGGLRIKRIESSIDAISSPILKTYTYSGANNLRSESLENNYITILR